MHRFARLALCAAVLATFASYNAMAAQAIAPDPEDGDLVPTGKGWGERANGNAYGQGNGQFGVGSNGIYYHGGPVMTGTTKAYYIWYGNWASNTAMTILPDLISHMGGSPWFNINTSYYSGSVHVTNAVTLAGQTTNNTYNYGKSLSDNQIQSVVADAINSNSLPRDTSGVYFVLTSSDVTASSGFCTQYCGWHTHGTIGGSDIKYAFIGNADRCPSACAWDTTVSPNGNIGADAMASIISHELSESVTDPDLNAWYDRRGQENADKCAWTFGPGYTSSNGAFANVHLGSRDFLIQRNWVNASGGYCSMSY
jgi:hypothetical protein